MRIATTEKSLIKGEKIPLKGLAIVTSGSVELILRGKPIWVYPAGTKAGYELVFKKLESVNPKLRALEDTELTLISAKDLRELYKANGNFKRVADEAITTTIITLLKEVLTSHNTSLETILKRLVISANGCYCPPNVAELCKDLGYSRNQYYKAVKRLQKLGIYYEGHCLVKKENGGDL